MVAWAQAITEETNNFKEESGNTWRLMSKEAAVGTGFSSW